MNEDDFNARKDAWDKAVRELEAKYRWERDTHELPLSTYIVAFIAIYVGNHIAIDLMYPQAESTWWYLIVCSGFDTMLGAILWHAAKITQARNAWYELLNNPPQTPSEPSGE